VEELGLREGCKGSGVRVVRKFKYGREVKEGEELEEVLRVLGDKKRKSKGKGRVGGGG
jgi:hypothetical protein